MTAHIGIIGAGLAARSHALGIVTDPALELGGVVSRSRESAVGLCDLFGGTVYPDVDSLIADRTIDAIVVAVPTPVVLDIAERVSARKPCLVEKPVATTPSELRRLARLAACCPRMVAPFTRRYQPTTQQAAGLIRSGELGAVISIDLTWRGPYRSRFDSSASTYRARTQQRHGVLTDTGSHALDTVSCLMGEQKALPRVDCRFTTNDRGTEVEASLRIRAGVPIRLSLIDDPEAVECGGWSVSVLAENGSVRLTNTGASVQAGHDALRHNPAGPMQRPATDLLRLLEGDQPVGASLAEAVDVSRTIVCAYMSISESAPSWIRPRGKALGRLNGAC